MSCDVSSNYAACVGRRAATHVHCWTDSVLSQARTSFDQYLLDLIHSLIMNVAGWVVKRMRVIGRMDVPREHNARFHHHAPGRRDHVMARG